MQQSDKNLTIIEICIIDVGLVEDKFEHTIFNKDPSFLNFHHHHWRKDGIIIMLIKGEGVVLSLVLVWKKKHGVYLFVEKR